MTHKQAVKVAVEAMEKEAKHLAFDANLHEQFGVDNPSAVNAYERRKELREAIAILAGQPNLI